MSANGQMLQHSHLFTAVVNQETLRVHMTILIKSCTDLTSKSVDSSTETWSPWTPRASTTLRFTSELRIYCQSRARQRFGLLSNHQPHEPEITPNDELDLNLEVDAVVASLVDVVAFSPSDADLSVSRLEIMQ